MKKYFILVILFTTVVMTTEDVCLAKGDWATRISCPSTHVPDAYSIVTFAQDGQKWIGLDIMDFEFAGHGYGDILTKVPLREINTCPYDSPNVVVGGEKPIIYQKDIHPTQDVTENLHYLKMEFDEPDAFKCLCKFNFHLLNGCTVDIYDRYEKVSDSLGYEYRDYYTCNDGIMGDKKTVKTED